MDLGVRGKVALVSASSKGLGRAIAEELAREGADLVMCARGEEALRQAADSIRKTSGSNVVEVAADVSEAAGIDRVAKTALYRLGKVDILVTNSGGPPSGYLQRSGEWPPRAFRARWYLATSAENWLSFDSNTCAPLPHTLATKNRKLVWAGCAAA